MPKVQTYNGITEHIFPNQTAYIKAMERGEVKEGDKVYIEETDTPELPVVTDDDNGKVLQVEGGEWTAKELPESGGDNDEIFPWAKRELFSKEDLVDSAGINSFITIDGVEYYRYHCGQNNFVWNNPKPYPGAVTITARAVAQYGGTGGTRLKTVYDDGTYGPDLYVIVGGESRTVTVTTDENKTLVKITGNYDMENWALLDMSVMSCIADYNIGLPTANAYVPGGVVADPVQEGDTKPVRIGADGRLYTEPDGAVPDEKITEAVNQYLDENGVKSLPDVTEADNGKALQVDNGKWVAKELPESGGSVSGDYIPVPSTAEVGQTIVVKSVGENGKPTEWETADMASGVGGAEIDISRQPDLILEVSEGVVSLSISEINGEPIDTTEMVVLWEHPGGAQYVPNYFRFNNEVKNSTVADTALANFNLPNSVCPNVTTAAAILCRVKKINNGTYWYEYSGLQQNAGTLTGVFPAVYGAPYRNILIGETSIKEFYVYQSSIIQKGCKVSVWMK